MASRASARRHAQAVFQIALERDELEKWRGELRDISDVLTDPELLKVLESPKVSLKEKMGLVESCLPGIGDLALNLAYLLVARGRLGIIEEVASEYERLVGVHQGVEQAEVVTAIPLTAEEEDRLAEQIGSLTGNKVLVKTNVDTGIIGGFTARIGDRLIDGSIRSRVEALRRSLIESRR